LPDGLDPTKHAISIPVHGQPEVDTIYRIRQLDALGLRVDLSKGCSAIDVVRNFRASDAMEEGLESLFFIDADMLFDPMDVVHLLMHPAPVIGGVYVPKRSGNAHVNAQFASGVDSVRFGQWAEEVGPYPALRIGAGFLRIKTWVFRRIVEKLRLPLCRMADRHAFPLFCPFWDTEQGEARYYAEDYAFCKRCEQAGTPIVADTSIRIYHLGSYAYGLEDATTWVTRYRNLESGIKDPQPQPVDLTRERSLHPVLSVKS